MQSKMQKRMCIGTVVVLASLLVGCGEVEKAQLIEKKIEKSKVPEFLTETMVAAEEARIQASIVYCDAIIDFEALKEENEDVYAWLNVPGTDVDYPVLQSEKDNYYLEHNMDHSKGRPGCIYTNACHPTDFSAFNTILYGHNMKNGTMFGTLHNFDDEDFFCENSIFYIYTEKNRLTYEICATRKVGDYYLPSYYNFLIESGQELFLNDMMSEVVEKSDKISHVREGVEMTLEDSYVTLSTCIRGEDTKRFLVVGKLIEIAEYSENSQVALAEENN